MQKDMTRGPILPLIFQFLLPLFVGNVFQQLYNMADMIIVGRYVGAGALAAVGSTGTLMFLVLGFALGITAGFGILTSQRFGAKDEAGVRRSVANGTLLALLLSVAMTLLSTAAVPWFLDLLNTPADILEDARTYITIIFQGLFTSVFYNMASVFLRSVGNSRAPLFFLVFSACLNVGLDLLCIIQFGMGVAGAALATVVSQGISVLLCIVYILKKEPVLVPEKKDWGLYAYETREQLRMGVPMALQFSITASGIMIAQSAINLFGSAAAAAYTAASKVSMLLTQGCLSMGQTMATYAGQNFGKGDLERIRQGVKKAFQMMLLYSILAAAVLHFLLPFLMGFFFSGDGEIRELMPWARTYGDIAMWFYLPLSLIFICRNAMQGVGYALAPTLCGVFELVARGLTALVGMRTHSYAISAACDPMAWLVAGLFAWFAWQWVMRDLEKKQARGKQREREGDTLPGRD
ncbi:MATE family efflux transporter [Acidaminococcus timonensis]|uniref:MATE family efflux transporter n=1 Tax=Acidaminococcus timonensis TaxID=1871002 RepID=UPI0008D9CEAB|nr:MATE family efflux transporter [Acidaminococcus timonensis]